MEAADGADLFGWHSSMAVPEDGGRRRRALTGRRTGGRPGAPKSGNEDSNFSTSVTSDHARLGLLHLRLASASVTSE